MCDNNKHPGIPDAIDLTPWLDDIPWLDDVLADNSPLLRRTLLAAAPKGN